MPLAGRPPMASRTCPLDRRARATRFHWRSNGVLPMAIRRVARKSSLGRATASCGCTTASFSVRFKIEGRTTRLLAVLATGHNAARSSGVRFAVASGTAGVSARPACCCWRMRSSALIWPDRIALDLEVEGVISAGAGVALASAAVPQDRSMTLTVDKGSTAGVGRACAGVAASAAMPASSAAERSEGRAFLQIMHLVWRTRSIGRVDGTG